jgi:hypothetical protein
MSLRREESRNMKFNVIALACAVLLAAGLSLSSFAGDSTDTDTDGVPDGWDNCIEVPNVQSCDTDKDGYGNACDCDYDNSGACGAADFNAFKARFLETTADINYDENYDNDCDGDVGADAFNTFKSLFLEDGYGTNVSNGNAASSGEPISGLPCAPDFVTPCEEDF